MDLVRPLEDRPREMRHELDLLALILAGAYLGELGSIEQRAVVVGSGNRGAENRIEQL
jgi:hypothetical protein